MSFGTWIKKASPIILTCLGAIGTVATAVIASKNAMKADELRWKAEYAKEQRSNPEKSSEEISGEKLTPFELVKAEIPAYLPAIGIGVGTLICIFGASALNFKQQASLASAYALAERTYHQYKDKVKSVIGEEADHAVEKAVAQEEDDILDDRPPWDEVQTFYIANYDKFFERTMEQVMKAEYHLNRNFVLRGSATFNELLSFLDIPPIKDGDEIGWFDYEGEVNYGYRWVDFSHRFYTTDDGMIVCAIDMPFPSHPDGEELET